MNSTLKIVTGNQQEKINQIIKLIMIDAPYSQVKGQVNFEINKLKPRKNHLTLISLKNQKDEKKAQDQ